MKKRTHFYLTLMILFLVSILLTAQNDPTPDAWEDNGVFVKTDSRVQMNSHLYLSSNSRLGINTTAPIAPIDIRGLAWPLYTPGVGLKVFGRFNNYAMHITNNFNSRYGGGLLIETSNASINVDSLKEVNALKVVTQYENHATEPHVMLRIPHSAHTFGNLVLLAEDGGRVGIGTRKPENALDVCGFIRSEEVIVEDEWCDFVFDKNYKLPTLAEQKSFIATNGHLKNFQSEAEMNGQIHLGDVNKRQQQTIEEVMLYLIQMKAELQALKNHNNVLRLEIEQLKANK